MAAVKKRGINNAAISGSNIISARERDQQQRIEAQALRAAAATAAGHNPNGTTAASGVLLNDRQNLFKRMRTAGRDGITDEMRDRARELGVKDTSFDAAVSRLSATATKPASTSAGTTATKPAATTPPASTGVPILGDALDIAGRLPRPEPESMIDGKPAAEVLRGMRNDAAAAFEMKVGPEPFSPTKGERALEEASKPSSGTSGTPGPAGVATPAPTPPSSPVATPPTTTAVVPAPKEEPSPASVPEGAPTERAKAPNVIAEALPYGSVVSKPGLIVSAAAGRGANALAKTGNAIAAEGKVAHEVATAAGDKVARMTRAAKRITGKLLPKAVGAAQDASNLFGEAFRGMSRLPVGDPLEASAKRAVQVTAEGVRRTGKAATNVGRGATAIQGKLGSAVQVADDLATKSNALASKSSAVLGQASKLGKVSKVLGKAAVPVEVAMNVVEAGRLLGSEKHRERRLAEFNANAERGALVAGLESALNPVAGIYGGATNINEWRKSAQGAADSAAALKQMEGRLAKEQQGLARMGHTKESLRALPLKERGIILRQARAQARAN